LRLTEEMIIPSYRKEAGFRGYLLLTAPDGTRAMAITLWDTEADMEASAHVAQAMIPQLRGILSAPPSTETYEVLFNVQA
jgi:quinol monooxygenase YgiN